ncbi:AbrB/MazE/SpoVT family DNA-binding domain-containing protein [Bacillaceae bacterium CLA-AA-H227]|uniref:AbrB/MazE/SpoVT family DNA-binding domain-containing protein n=2 Tax=Robertmurraya TaxID=2837507 RepID=A0A4U1D1J9_9BACI|nr:AbrB/MazE/SpoVT family DNA-binding domain-containing protein [Robertmurraya kyonggiensis]TKC15037.1 AbrB/MazE/SpoVT family DNA-binding domain-containing protein [Robertmurraya kyonggiensis]
MKSIGVVRKVDELGRIVLPVELRKTFNIKEKDPIEIYTDQDKIILKKFIPYKECAVTGEVREDNKTYFNNLTLSPEGVRLLMEELNKEKVTI